MGRGFKLGLSDIGLSNSGKRIIYENKITTNYRFQGKLVPTRDIRALARAIDGGFQEALQDIRDNIRRNLAEAITADIWRTNDGIGDIYLSGDLLRSQDVTSDGSGNIVISYDVPYASLIYYGGYILPYGNESSKKVYIPPRPWIISVINGLNGIPEIDYGRIIYAALSASL